VIETIDLPSGTSDVSPAFSGTFSSWFTDGHRFITNTGSTFWVYSSAAVQQALVSLPGAGLTGQGDWVWTYNPTGAPSVQVYAIGSTTPAQTFPLPTNLIVTASGTTIGAYAYGAPGVSVIDLSSSTPTQINSATVPVLAYMTGFAAASGSQWIAGNENGVILDGASLSGTPRFFGYGAALSIAGTSDMAAIATASGKILLFDPSGPTSKGDIGFLSGKLAMSTDGSVLGASGYAQYAQYETDRSLNFYSLPSTTVISNFPYTYPTGSTYSTSPPFLADFSLSGSGTVIGQELVSYTTRSDSAEVTGISGSPVIWSSDGGFYPIVLSPDGTLIAVSSGNEAASIFTNIYRNGTLVTAVPGGAQAWIDNGRLLVGAYANAPDGSGPYLTGNMTIYSPDGVVLATVSKLPEQLTYPQIVGSDEAYCESLNAIYSLTTGAVVWQGPIANEFVPAVGAVAGPYVVFPFGHLIVRDSH
jgi:hypothetical protein